ncbi:MAG: DsrE family protein [Anaerolineaceae bacterium]|nr:DsrE family protein [Anaerolineaceae bacterium]
MKTNDVILFTRFGLGDGPAALQQSLAVKYLALLLESGELPGRILFYTEGVRLACTGSPVLDSLKQIETQKVELVLCKTCLDFLGLAGEVQVGVIGGMGDILETLQKAPKVVSV